jgi:hypothetical protein
MENLNRDGVVDLLTKLNVPCGVIFWTIKNGCPLSNSYTLQVVGCWTCVDFESMGISFTYIPRCAICGRTDTPHKLSKRPLLATMNKIQGKGMSKSCLRRRGRWWSRKWGCVLMSGRRWQIWGPWWNSWWHVSRNLRQQLVNEGDRWSERLMLRQKSRRQ